jgi:hypothetical protein
MKKLFSFTIFLTSFILKERPLTSCGFTPKILANDDTNDVGVGGVDSVEDWSIGGVDANTTDVDEVIPAADEVCEE